MPETYSVEVYPTNTVTFGCEVCPNKCVFRGSRRLLNLEDEDFPVVVASEALVKIHSQQGLELHVLTDVINKTRAGKSCSEDPDACLFGDEILDATQRLDELGMKEYRKE